MLSGTGWFLECFSTIWKRCVCLEKATQTVNVLVDRLYTEVMFASRLKSKSIVYWPCPYHLYHMPGSIQTRNVSYQITNDSMVGGSKCISVPENTV